MGALTFSERSFQGRGLFRDMRRQKTLWHSNRFNEVHLRTLLQQIQPHICPVSCWALRFLVRVASASSFRLLEEVVRHPPSISSLICEQLGASQIEDMPSIEPHRHSVFPVRLFQMRPYLALVFEHLDDPILECHLASSTWKGEASSQVAYLASLSIMLPIDPPLLLQLHILLEIVQQVRRRHRAPREKIRAHPTGIEIIRCGSVVEDVNESLPLGLQRPRNLGHEQFIILHVLEELDRDDAIKRLRFELVIHHIARDDLQILQPLFFGLPIDVELLRLRIRESSDLRVGEHFRKVERPWSPSTSWEWHFCQPSLCQFEVCLGALYFRAP